MADKYSTTSYASYGNTGTTSQNNQNLNGTSIPVKQTLTNNSINNNSTKPVPTNTVMSNSSNNGSSVQVVPANANQIPGGTGSLSVNNINGQTSAQGSGQISDMAGAWNSISSMLNNGNTVPVEETAAEETAQKYGITPEAAQATQDYLNNYNADREQRIRDLYAGNIAAQNARQKTALDASMANIRNAYQQNTESMRNAYEQNLSDANAARAQISPRYQQGMNALSAEYERQRRNNNMQGAVNGLNTGAGSQLALGQSMGYQATQGQMSRSEQEALNEADRAIGDLNRDYNNRNSSLEMQYNNSLADLQTNYENKIAEAAANNDYQLAAALLDEYGAQYDRIMQQADRMAEFGDFSMYANIYGIDAANEMERAWAMQNPQVAWAMGKLSADDYYKLTGMMPYGYDGSGLGGSGNYGALASRLLSNPNAIGYMSNMTRGNLSVNTNPGDLVNMFSQANPGGRMITRDKTGATVTKEIRAPKQDYGYSASRDRAYRGPAGYYDEPGNFVVPSSGKIYGNDIGNANAGTPADQDYFRNLANTYGW